MSKLSAKGNFTLDGPQRGRTRYGAPQDSVNKRSQVILGNDYEVGQGVFVLSDAERASMQFTREELELIKPYYTTAELSRYFGTSRNSYWIIYTDSSIVKQDKIRDYPNIKKHLDQYRSIITSDNWPYGLHRSRNEFFFQGVKIISLRKCSQPTFTYTDFDCYVAQTFYIIKSNRINLKFLTGLLNSRVIEFWLRHKGKMQGYQFQIDKAPLLDIPIRQPTTEQEFAIETLVSRILQAKRIDFAVDTSDLETEIDYLVYELYGLTEDEIAIVEGRA
ncbi:MAG: hypothetical protein IPM84_14655 [Anaerolineae bacterium]|nr:hypothetical protein [Anaerolineae bacterium]